MALNGKVQRMLRHGRKKRDTAGLSERLAPLEEREETNAPAAAANNGSIIVDTAKLKLPKGFVEETKNESDSFRIEPVVIVIILIALAFIAFIAWQVSKMPDAP